MRSSNNRQGLKMLLAPVARRVTVAELLADFEADIHLRRLKIAGKVLHHAAPIRDYFKTTRAVDVTVALVDNYITARRAAGKSRHGPFCVRSWVAEVGRGGAPLGMGGPRGGSGHPSLTARTGGRVLAIAGDLVELTQASGPAHQDERRRRHGR